MTYLPPTITPADDEPTPIYQSTPIINETLPTITPVEPEIQYEEQPQIEYVEEPQIEYVEQPQIEYVEEPQVEYVEEPQIQYVEQPQIPVVQTPPPQQDDLTKYYAILDQFGPVENDDDFQLDGWKQFYPLDDPFFNWQKGNAGPNWRVYNPEDKMNLAVYEGDMLNGMRHGFGRLTTPKYVRLGTWRDDQFTGWGRESRRNGDVLEGKYIDGRVTGKGILKNAKGNLYVGDFVESRRHGYGELDTNRIHYKGGFLGDRLNGRGIIHFKVEGHDYDGDFKDNEINGNGMKEIMSMVSKKEKENSFILMDLSMMEISLEENQEEMLISSVAEKIFLSNIQTEDSTKYKLYIIYLIFNFFSYYF